MLASDEDGSSLDALKFSLASDIVELVVLTADAAFLHTMREAVGGARRLWHVPSADKVSDLLVAGEVGIVVLDVRALNEAAPVFIGQIKRQFPDLVVVVAGHREDEISLASLISAGTVYRFIHKPMSPARAKLFAEAAIKKHDGQRRRAAETPPSKPASAVPGGWLIGGTVVVLGLIAATTWLIHRRFSEDPLSASAEAARPSSAESTLLARAGAALAANRLTEPPGDNALELYQQMQPHTPADANARAAGLSEVHERLLARAENALLEERLDEAAAAIETARKSGVESGRIAFLTAQLAKSRDLIRAAQAKTQAQAQSQAQAATQARTSADAKPAEDPVAPLLDLASQRMDEGRLLGSDRDNARFYVQEALRTDPESAAAQETKRSLASRLLLEARGAIDHRDFARAASLLEGTDGIAVQANIDATQGLLAIARQQAETDAWSTLLKNANERLLQDRLIEPENDNAKYYLLTLRRLDPGNAALPAAMQDLGSRLLAKARRAFTLQQYDAARSWLDAAGEIAFSTAEGASLQHELDAAVAKQALMTATVPFSQLTLLKSVQPVYPPKAENTKIEGWVELDFTVTDSGRVKDVTVHAVSTPGLFEEAAVKAVSQWRYKPYLSDGKPAPVRTEIRVRFSLSGH